MKKTISKLLATALMAVGFVSSGVAQKNENTIGSACGCPAFNTRPIVNFSAIPGATYIRTNGVNQIASDVHLTCANTYEIDSFAGLNARYYLDSGFTMTIDPGTVIRGKLAANPTSANTAVLLIERGAKIVANGTKECNIVFTTDQDPMNGTYSMTNVGKWGGLVICGIATNSLTNAQPSLGTGTAGVGFCEGFPSANAYNLFGAGDAHFPTFNDNDNSGTLRYVSIRHTGSQVGGTGSGSEINALSLYSVGRGTTIDQVEILAAGDDDVELFGGTVNIKHIATYFGDDDKFDFDLGYSGKGQFLFALASDTLNSPGNQGSTDNGFECDADDDFTATATSNHSHPIFYNATLISNGHVLPKLDNTGSAGIQAKELTGGEFHNCIFANFRSGCHFSQARSTATNSRNGDAYDQWTSDGLDPYLVANGGKAQPQTLIVKNNVFIVPNDGLHYGFTKGTLVNIDANQKYIKNPAQYNATPGIPNSADSIQFLTTDGNQIVTKVNGIDYNYGFDATNTNFNGGNTFHATPSTQLTSPEVAPNDGFFTPVNYKGAFTATENSGSWLSDWGFVAYKTLIETNPTDLNKDGVTNVSDYNIFAPKFGTTDK